MNEFRLDFQDTATAFADKSNRELREKALLFRTMNSNALVNIGTRLTNWAFSIGLPVSGVIKSTIFRQFCGGETIAECEPVIKKLGASHVGTILDYSVEGKSTENVFNDTRDEILRTVERAKADADIPFAVFKVTGVARFELLEKIHQNENLSESEQQEWIRAQSRVEAICQRSFELNQPIFIDAEESWIQNAVDNLAMEMMRRFNRENPIIFNTIQLYRHDRLAFLKKSLETARNEGFLLAVKLVRGAYMEKERERAAALGYKSPIQPDKAATDRDYNEALRFCLDNIDYCAFVAGSHNEQSMQILARMMNEKGISANHSHVFFSQLYGMSDNLSYVLAKNGYNVSKYVPYGPVKDAIPYLMRRAKENTSVMGQMSRELEMLERELHRRNVR